MAPNQPSVEPSKVIMITTLLLNNIVVMHETQVHCTRLALEVLEIHFSPN